MDFDSQYLIDNVGPTLSKGLAEMVARNPPDKVDFLGRWLLKQVDDVYQAQQVAEKEKQLDELDLRLQEEDLARKEQQDKRQSEQETRTKNEADFVDFLETATDIDEVLRRFCEFVQQHTGSTAVYIADYDRVVDEAAEADEEDEEDDEDKPSEGSEEEEEPAAKEEPELDEEGNPYPPGTLKYRFVHAAADADDHSFLLDQQLTRSRGVTHELFPPAGDGDEDNEEEEEDADEESGVAKEKKKPERKLLSVASVLLGDLSKKIHFFRLPKVGSYLAFASSYGTLMNEEALSAEKLPEDMLPPKEDSTTGEASDEKSAAKSEDVDSEKDPDSARDSPETEENAKAEDAEDGGAESEEKEVIPPLKKNTLELAVCMDTLGQNRAYTQEEIDFVKGLLDLMEDALHRIDRSQFLQEYEQRRKFLAAESEVKGSAELSEEEKEKQLAALREELGGEGVPEEDVAFRHSQKIVVSMRAMISEFKSYAVFKGELKVLQCLCYMLDYKKDDVADAKNKPVWTKMRKVFGSPFCEKLSNYDPAAEQKRNGKEAYAKVKNLKKLLKGLTFDEIKESNFVLAQLFNYASTALAMKDAAKKRRQEEEAKRKEEEEATAAAAAEAAAAAAEEAENADGGDAEAAEEEAA